MSITQQFFTTGSIQTPQGAQQLLLFNEPNAIALHFARWAAAAQQAGLVDAAACALKMADIADKLGGAPRPASGGLTLSVALSEAQEGQALKELFDTYRNCAAFSAAQSAVRVERPVLFDQNKKPLSHFGEVFPALDTVVRKAAASSSSFSSAFYGSSGYGTLLLVGGVLGLAALLHKIFSK